MICKHLCTWVGFILLLSRCARSIDNDLGILKESCKQGHWIQIESMHPEHASNKHRKHSKQILPPPTFCFTSIVPGTSRTVFDYLKVFMLHIFMNKMVTSDLCILIFGFCTCMKDYH